MQKFRGVLIALAIIAFFVGVFYVRSQQPIDDLVLSARVSAPRLQESVCASRGKIWYEGGHTCVTAEKMQLSIDTSELPEDVRTCISYVQIVVDGAYVGNVLPGGAIEFNTRQGAELTGADGVHVYSPETQAANKVFGAVVAWPSQFKLVPGPNVIKLSSTLNERGVAEVCSK